MQQAPKLFAGRLIGEKAFSESKYHSLSQNVVEGGNKKCGYRTQQQKFNSSLEKEITFHAEKFKTNKIELPPGHS